MLISVRFGEEKDDGTGLGRDINPLTSRRVTTFVVQHVMGRC